MVSVLWPVIPYWQYNLSQLCNNILYTVHCTLYTVQFTLHTLHCTLYNIHCTLYTVHCTLCSTLAVLCSPQGCNTITLLPPLSIPRSYLAIKKALCLHSVPFTKTLFLHSEKPFLYLVGLTKKFGCPSHISPSPDSRN